ncbi:hypothetical protein [Microbacterium esteraromaticum]|uniref:hypothetical protein n=1 Tax=Microbacterium esteraromaticum TaxID=57043 RepID=UPI0019D3AD49|nr:hypothetical protein [Microbacterium esteraromaticum]MBN7793840.1 hypothetical protein [Microbacterium esteraromaticum]
MDFGSWAEIVAAVGGIAAAVVSIFALKTALAANRTAEHTRREAKDAADARNAREEQSQLAAVASQLQAWWVMWRNGEATRFGVLVTNAGDGATVFRNVRVETAGNRNARGRGGDITFTSLPPGSYVIPSNAAGADKPWGGPETVERDTRYEPLVKAHRYAVTRISFEDPTKAEWTWTPEMGLVGSSGR